MSRTVSARSALALAQTNAEQDAVRRAALAAGVHQQAAMEAQKEKAAEEERKEQARVNELVAKARAWHYRRFIGSYLDWVEEQQKAAAGGQIDPNGDFAKWLAWARRQSERPIVRSRSGRSTAIRPRRSPCHCI